MRLQIDSDIRRAATLPAEFYRSTDLFDELRERVFARSWQWVGFGAGPAGKGSALPFTLLEGCLDEPLVLTRDQNGELRCLSNVCSHRGNVVVTERGACSKLRCRYHGRRFGLDGKFDCMPEFEDVDDFPSASDDLPRVALESFEGHLFAALDPAHGFEQLVGEMRARVGHLPTAEFRHDPALSRDYLVDAHWALYVDNYLEGFHVPYVHPGLADNLDYQAYAVELGRRSSLQLGVARPGDIVFDAVPGADEARADVAAYYYWLFPNTMLNFYPWGLSLNVVQPLSIAKTKVSFHSFVWRSELRAQGAGGALDQVELEDEAVVEQVQRGVRSRLYRRGRYSPRREAAVHHFHRLLQEALE